MKLNNIMLAVVMSLGAVSVANAADGVLNITGTITDTACAVDATDTTLNVEMGNISQAAFTSPGAPVGAQTFTINAASCPAGDVMVRFDGSALPGSSNLVALTATGDEADGVGVGLYEMSGAQINLATNSLPQTVLPDNTIAMNFKAAYVAPGAVGTVESGDANAVVDFTLINP